MDAAVAALIGAAIGALPGIVAPLWTQHAESRRARMKLAVELGRDDFQFQREQAITEGGLLHPSSLYVAYHEEFLKALERGEFGPKAIADIEAKMQKIQDAFPKR